ncbi:hypothetical protein PR048_019534 [Dryococelus australis]|uniref:Elongator complex protein 4 n=1 Tax=Dryococelus australis TaxID=614101 RepID=A0ABQ9H410_9NEOP|nr:hypothetical protein PR048_019534 [Dryococelus australis]
MWQVSELPAPLESDTPPEGAQSDEKMTIAWRYQNMQAVSSSLSVRHFGHYYDVSKTMGQELLETADVNYWSYDKELQHCEGASLIF